MLSSEVINQLGVINKKQRKVTRTWKTKSGKIKSKTYVYDESNLIFRKGKDGKYIDIIDKDGKTRFQKLRDSVDKMHINTADRITLKNELDIEYNEIMNKESVYASELQGGYNRIDVNSMVSRLHDERLDKLATNLGVSVTDLADELGVSESDLRNAEFEKGKVKLNGKEYAINFKYNESHFIAL